MLRTTAIATILLAIAWSPASGQQPAPTSVPAPTWQAGDTWSYQIPGSPAYVLTVLGPTADGGYSVQTVSGSEMQRR